MNELPVIDLGDALDDIGVAIDRACRDVGFFTAVGHGVAPDLFTDLRACAAAFFARDEFTKSAIAMSRGGSAWRGWFPLHGELTSGVPDDKEGLYFGTELPLDDPRVRAGIPLHGPNLFPDHPSELRDLTLEAIASLRNVGERVLTAMALGLGLPTHWFSSNLTADPTVLFRIFRYPPHTSRLGPDQWGVREHTDYGLVTVLAHDGTPGLQVHAPNGWVDGPTDPSTFVVNVGDMLEKLTRGRYRSTPHRVANESSHDRYSFPLFLDPSWEATVVELPLGASDSDARPRWDGEDPVAWSGTYGDYLTTRVARVFPDLFAAIDE